MGGLAGRRFLFFGPTVLSYLPPTRRSSLLGCINIAAMQKHSANEVTVAKSEIHMATSSFLCCQANKRRLRRKVPRP